MKLDPSSSAPAAAHSALVSMRLVSDTIDLPIAQLGPDFLILENPADLAPRSAEIVLRGDSTERRWPVNLPDGIDPATLRTRIASR
jgi:hypothetical protein